MTPLRQENALTGRTGGLVAAPRGRGHWNIRPPYPAGPHMFALKIREPSFASPSRRQARTMERATRREVERWMGHRPSE